MGQRANYIIIENGKQTIHYNHWRANSIASDLFLGESSFIEFVKDCKIDSAIINEPWIEGCVIINLQKKQLYFWSYEFGQTSVVDIYLNELQHKWKGWKLNLLYNRMYDVEKILNIDYVSKQEIQNIYCYTKEEILQDKVSDWTTSLIIIKQENKLIVTKTESLTLESILKFGNKVVDLLLDKPNYELPKEEDDEVCECMVIDIDNKKIVIGKSEFGLVEQALEDWKGFEFEIGDFGYIGTLRIAKIDTSKISMSIEKAQIEFKTMIEQDNDFNPNDFADRILKENPDTKFNPDFFDNVKPKISLFNKIKKILGLK